MNAQRIIILSMTISFFISGFYLVHNTVNKYVKQIVRKEMDIIELNIEISELKYKLLNCRLNTINELSLKEKTDE